MKKLTIFLILLFFISAIFFNPDNVTVGTAVTDRLLENFSVFEDLSSSAVDHLNRIEHVKIGLQQVTIEYVNIPDTFESAGTLQGIGQLLYSLVLTISYVFSVPLIILGVLISFIIDAITLIFNLLSLLDIFKI